MRSESAEAVSPQSAAGREAPGYVKALALGLSAYLAGVHLWTWVFNVSTFLAGAADFRQLYSAARMIVSGRRLLLYDYLAQFRAQNAFVSPRPVALPFNHPAYEALVFVPLSYLSYRSAYLSFLAMNCGLLVLVYVLLRPWMSNLHRIYRWLPAAMFVAFLPVAAALIQGQDSIILLALLAGSLAMVHRRSEVVAGGLLGLGLFKFQIVLPIACLFLVWRRWRWLAGFSAAAGCMGAVSVAIVGFAGTSSYLQSLLSMSILSSADSLLIYRIDPAAMPNLRGLLHGLAAGTFPDWAVQAAIGTGSVLVLLWAGLIGRKEPNLVDRFLLAITTSALVSYHLLIHDLSILLIPIVVSLNRFVPGEINGDSRERLAARISVLAWVSPLCESFAPEHFYLVALAVIALLFVLVRGYNQTRAVGAA